jgi:ABC-type transport system involved in cytochrome c biogenesis permease subunit
MILSTIAFVQIALSVIVRIVFLFLKTGSKARELIPHALSLAAAVLLFATTVLRSIEMRFIAVTNLFESLVLFSGFILVILFVFIKRLASKSFPLVTLGCTIVALGLLAIASSPVAPKEVLPPVPALRSVWLQLHVVFAFIGEAFFAVSFIAACLYFLTKSEDGKAKADSIIYTSIGIGYPIYTIGALIFGAIWAQTAWGRFWGWDNKEVWALVTWLVYTVYLHVRLIMKKRGNVTAAIAVIGFIVTLFTLFGVNFLLRGLHSYT